MPCYVRLGHFCDMIGAYILEVIYIVSFILEVCSAYYPYYGGPEGTSLHKFFIALHKF